MEQFISDIVKAGDFQTGTFNLIDAGCGSGKTYFCVNHLFRIFPGVSPAEIVVMTSRSITANQMEQNDKVDVNRLFPRDLQEIAATGITVMTFDTAAEYLWRQSSGRFVDDDKKIIVVDECHALFSDTFMKDIHWIKAMMNMIVARGKALVIGLTATSGIVRRYWGDVFTSTRDVCPPIPTRYPAKHLTLTRLKYVPGLIKTFSGKTLILVQSTRHAKWLHRMIPNSAVVISKSHKKLSDDDIDYEQYMDNIRQYIIDNRTLPGKVTDRSYKSGCDETYSLDVLIATTTLREGFNLDEVSGVRNIVCCFFDELHITQFLGRCRYSVDNLVVAPPKTITFKGGCAEYFDEFQDSYRRLWSGEDNEWLGSVKGLVSGDVYQDADIFTCEVEDVPESFDGNIEKYLNGDWFYNDDWKRIVVIAKEWRVLPDTKLDHYSRTNVKEYICSLGYVYQAEQDKTRNKRARYRFIKETDENESGTDCT